MGESAFVRRPIEFVPVLESDLANPVFDMTGFGGSRIVAPEVVDEPIIVEEKP